MKAIQEVAAVIGFNAPSEVIPNPYDDTAFVEDIHSSRERDLVFVGRLVSDKGVDLLLEALALLRERGLEPALTIVGGGPEESALKARVDELKLAGQVCFAGVRRGADLTAVLNRHRILVVPSRWNEPFGIVALEGMACGCVVVGSEGGGLPEAIGPGGVTFPNGDVAALAERLAMLLTHPEQLAHYQSAGRAHLARHRPDAVATAYLHVLEQAREDLVHGYAG